jgi:uncharacterized protein YbbC (DUF1343 family)/CubicO group peptidase (beta-lactamase class C family)
MNRPSGFAVYLTFAVVFVAANQGFAQVPLTKPEDVGVSSERLDRIDATVKAAIERGNLPGAVVLIVHRDRVVFRRAYGLRNKLPAEVAMTEDTVFDLASLTKPIATATSLMLLVEQGKVRVSDPVAQYLPAFAAKGKEKITLEQLLLHTSGLIADNAVADYKDGHDKAIERICDLTPTQPPGAKFVYSDVNFIVLGEIVAKVSGKPLDEFAKANIYQPLGMTATGYKPDDVLKKRCAPTEQREGHWMIGEVHDPRSYLLGGVAGHAGLFSTADDLAVYARMLLHEGSLNGKRILSPQTVRFMTTPRDIPLTPTPLPNRGERGRGEGQRTYGWDAKTSFSSNRGELFKGFGHTGFTGTSLWIDPDSDTAVIFLSNRVHPDGKGNVTRVRGQVATLAAAALNDAQKRKTQPVLTGIDVLVRDGFAPLKGRRIGLVTNHTGVDRQGRATIDLLHKADGVTLVALFSPEHGIRGAVDAQVADSKDDKTGLPIYSLYGTRRKPTAETLKGIDTLVFDIQDAGCRFYTYISTLGLVMEAAAENKLRVVVLDRPNPLGGLAVDGPLLDAGKESFVAYHTLPIRYGLTLGELAQLYNTERKLGCDLQIIKLEGWKRGDLYDRTGLHWINPSPNLRGLTATLLYPGVGLLETTNVSVGRGTDRPFEWIGAPWLDGEKLAAALTKHDLPGVRFMPLRMTPTSSTHKDKKCDGVQILLDDWSRFQPLRTGMALACELRRLHPEEWQVDKYKTLLGHQATLDALKKGATPAELERLWQEDLTRFRERAKTYWLYSE